MSFIQIVKREINYNDIIDWRMNHMNRRNRFEDLYNTMIETGATEEQIRTIWEHNFGEIPPKCPEKFYFCNIYNKDIRIIVTVLKKENVQPNELEYKVVKLNKIYMDSTKFKFIVEKEMIVSKLYLERNTVDKATKSQVELIDGNLYFTQAKGELINGKDILLEIDTITRDANEEVEPEEIILESNNKTIPIHELVIEDDLVNIKSTNAVESLEQQLEFKDAYETIIENDFLLIDYDLNDNTLNALNYEDSEWLSLVSIKHLLKMLKIRIDPYESAEGEIFPNPIPKAFVYSMDSIEIIDFDFADLDFKENLFKTINNEFKKILEKR